MFERRFLSNAQEKAVLQTVNIIANDMFCIVNDVIYGKKGCLYDIVDNIDVIKQLLKPFLKDKEEGITYDNVCVVDRHLRDAILYQDAYKAKSCIEVIQNWINELISDIIENS